MPPAADADGLSATQRRVCVSNRYDSLVDLWAGDWGIDLVKLDCVNAEDESANHRLDVLAISRALQAATRHVRVRACAARVRGM
jgi:hypothetical protein